MTIRAQLFDPTTGETKNGGAELLDDWRARTDTKIWIDLHNVEPREERALLQDAFNVPAIAVTDAQMTRRPPKVEPFEGGTFILLKGLDAETRDIEFNTIQIALFVGERFFVTRHAEISLSTDKLWDLTEKGEKKLADGCDTLAVALINIVMDRYLPILLAVEDRLEFLEEEVTLNPRDELLTELIALKANLTKMQRVMANHANVFEVVVPAPPKGIRSSLRHDLRGIHEKLERYRSLSSLYYSLASDLSDGYISIASHHLNSIMKVLTVVASIFIPLTFLAGIYGMNFETMPELGYRYAYFILLGVMLLLGVGLIVLFRRKNWL